MYNTQEIQEFVKELNSIKNELVRLNDYLILNMNTETSKKINRYLLQKTTDFNNLIEKMNKINILVSEYYYKTAIIHK